MNSEQNEIIAENSTEYQIKSDALCSSPRSGLSFIEQLQIVASKQCEKERRPYLVGVHETSKKAMLTKPACKMWNCEACGSRMARQWIAKIINGINITGGLWSFLTLTAHSKQRKEKSVPNLRSGWKKLYNRILAERGKTAEGLYYAKVWEQHEEGSYHLHILINENLGTRWAKDNAAACGLGYQAEWHDVSNAGKVAGYISKYTLKNATIARGGIKAPKGLRRIETSRNWHKLPKLSASSEIEWILKMTRREQIQSAQRYFIRGFEIIDTVSEPQDE